MIAPDKDSPFRDSILKKLIDVYKIHRGKTITVIEFYSENVTLSNEILLALFILGKVELTNKGELCFT